MKPGWQQTCYTSMFWRYEKYKILITGRLIRVHMNKTSYEHPYLKKPCKLSEHKRGRTQMQPIKPVLPCEDRCVWGSKHLPTKCMGGPGGDDHRFSILVGCHSHDKNHIPCHRCMVYNQWTPWEPKTFIFRGYDPYIEGLKPSFFMVLGSKGK